MAPHLPPPPRTCLRGSPGPGKDAASQKLSAQALQDHSPLVKTGAVVLSYADVIEKIRDSVVTILVKQKLDLPPLGALDPADAEKAREKDFNLYPPDSSDKDDPESRRRSSSGSGVVLTASGLIVTNAHVVRLAETVNIRLRGQEEDIPATLVGLDAATDIALLKVERTDLKPATLGDSAIIRPGDIALALGSPFGLEQTITLGIIEGGMEDFIQTDAAINPLSVPPPPVPRKTPGKNAASPPTSDLPILNYPTPKGK